MALPYISITKRNGNAVPAAAASSKALIIGPASSGVKETTLYTFGTIGDIASTIGYGNAQLCSELVMAMAPSGFGSVDVLVSSASIAGTLTEVSAASPVIAITGTPLASYDIRADITTAGVSGSCKFRYSLDGGNTYTENLQSTTSTSGAYVIPNTGLTMSFAAGTHAVGNLTHYYVQGPMMNTTDLASCISTLANSNTNYTTIIVADDSPAPVSCSALFSAMDTHLTTLNNTQYKPTMAVVNVGGESKLFNRTYASTTGTYTSTNVLANITGSAASTGNFIAAVAEKVNTYIAVPQPGYARPRLPFAFAVGAEIHAVGDDLSKNISQDPIRRVETPSYDEFQAGTVYHDERVIAPRTFRGESGLYVNQGVLKYNPVNAGSYNFVPKGRIANRASEIARTAIRPFLNTRVRTLTDGTGRIDPIDKLFIEASVQKQLEAVLFNVTNGAGTKGHVSAIQFSLNGENNVLSTGLLQGTILMVPFVYVTTITIDIFFTDIIV